MEITSQKLMIDFNNGRTAISKLNSILWDRNVTSKTKTHICHAVVKSTITYSAETWCLKANTVSKLNSTEMDFWRRSARISRKDKIGNTIIKKMNVTRSLLDDIKTTSVVWPCSKNGRRNIAKRSYEMASAGKKKTR